MEGKSFEISAKNLGVQVYCAERFSVGNSTVPKAIRICITAPKDVEELEKGLNIIISLIHISYPTIHAQISYAVFFLKKKKKQKIAGTYSFHSMLEYVWTM
ncbi:hypothetical protein JSCD8_26600 [Clostridioides difficile]|nr:hypothetical protein JSCD8_26600 [Clostridioides difficile]